MIYIHQHERRSPRSQQQKIAIFTSVEAAFRYIGPYSQRDFKPRSTKHDFNDFSIGDKINT